jgi:hypothetical protein
VCGRDIDGRIADVGGCLGRDVPEELEALEERGGVGLVLSGILHCHKSVHGAPQSGKGAQRHLKREAPLGGYDGQTQAGITQAG